MDDLVDGLALGADDYMGKPFAFAELVARVRALGRRAGEARPAVLRAGDIELDPARHTATRAARELDLSPKEFGVLEILLGADGATVSGEELLRAVWDEHADPFTNTVRMTMMKLRRKLGDPSAIETVTGAGLPDLAMTVRARLTAAYALLFCATVGVLLGASYWLLSRHFDRTLSDAAARDALDAVGLQYLLAFGGTVLLALAAGWMIAGRALAPIGRMTAFARRVSGERLDERLALEGPADELRELADTLDAMLDGLSESFDAQRRFVANAGHELRGPLTVIRTEAEVTLADPSASREELRAMGEAVVEACRRTEALLEGLMALARSQRAPGAREPLDLAPGARAAVAAVAEEARAADVRVRLDAGPPRPRATGGCSSGWWPTSWRTPCATTGRAARWT